MIKSMTGYGKGQATVETLTLNVEIKSVNHRYCDVTVKGPRFLSPYENEIKKSVTERVGRGRVDLYVSQELGASTLTVPVVNRPLAAAWLEALRQMQREFALEGDIPLSLLAAQKDVVVMREADPDATVLTDCLQKALQEALQAIDRMRLAEGEATWCDIASRLELLETMLQTVEERAPQVPEEWRQKLSERLARLGPELSVEPQRVAQEVAIFADRCDISEEVTRFKSHLSQFRLLAQGDEPVGRQMDFLVQELNREVNTMGSKSNDAMLTKQVVAMKAELEKIREQVQNVE
ncbi:MAG: YicC family protein [Desulfuromonas sp.]|nr:MAG: YicC family protein [Desulfuromonas sp.]